MIGAVPTTAFAENGGAQDSGITIGASGLCEHHTEHTTDCGYTEGALETPCNHEHTSECYPADSVSGNEATSSDVAEPTNCTHTEHTGDCGYVPGVEGTAEIPCTHEHDDSCGYVPASEGVEETPCAHEHDEGCGYAPAVEGAPETACTHEHGAECYPADSVPGNVATPTDAAEPTNCTHTEHTADCGYAPAVEGTPCGYVCEICNPTVKTITAWAWNDEYELIVDGSIGLIWDSVAWDDLAPMLPSITAVIGEAEEILTLDWGCADVVDGLLTAGTHILTAALPEGYALGEGIPALTLTLEMGGGAVFAGETGDFTVTGDASNYLYDSNSHTLYIKGSGEITISGATYTDKIVVVANTTANITLSGLSIDVSGTTEACAFTVNASATCNLTLTGTNILKSGYWKAGLEVSAGAVLTITENSTGSLDATGGFTGAGIGGSSVAGGKITINGGTVTATGGENGAGIGGGSRSAGGEITINGGTVTATGSANGAGIGGGGAGGNAVGGAGGTITISGGTVTATGGGNGAGIGGGAGGNETLAAAGDFSTTDQGNAFINASSIQDNDDKTGWKGVIFGGEDDKSIGKVYGSPVELTTDAEIPDGKELVIENGQELKIKDGTTLTNNGKITNNGQITGSGTIDGSGELTGGGTSADSITNNLPVAPTITTSPTGQSVTYGQPATFSVAADGKPTLSYQWQVSKDGSTWEDISGATGTSYTISNPDVSMNGWKYHCVVTTLKGTVTSDAATLTVTAAQLAAPQNLQWDGTTPGKATWGAVTGASGYSVQLYKDGAAVNGAVGTPTEANYTFSITEVGTYTFKVKAISNNVNYTDSAESEASGALVFYTVTWQNESTTLETDVVMSGDTPAYNGTTPTKSDDGTYTYTHSGWTPSVGAITGDTTYTATYSKAYLAPAASTGYTISYTAETATATSGYEISLNGSTWSGGLLDITPGGTLYVRKAATTGNDPVSASAATQNTLDPRPGAPTGISGVNESWQGDNDGQITGLTANGSYQISFNNGVWQDKTADASGNITGLAAGSYKIRIVADTSNKKFASEAADVTIATGPARTYTLNVTAPTFDTVTYGYTQPDAKGITISSTGNSNATITGVALSGAGAGSFTLNKTDGTTITAGTTDNTTYTVQPNARLDAGTYTATITVTYNGGATATATVTFVVNGLTQAAPDAPELESKTTSSITLKEIAPNTNGAAAEYRMNGGAWQTSRTFSGLSSNTSYSFEARYAATGNYEASPASPAVSIATNGSGGGGGGGGYDDGDDDYTPPTPPIVQPETSESDGWSEIRAELRSARPGDTIIVKMNGATVVPKEVSREIVGKDVTVIFDMGGSVSWTVNGKDIPQSIVDLDLGIKTNSNTIPVSVINAITGEITTMQFELSHSGPFGTILHLTLNVGRENSGYWANLYHLNGKELVFQYASRIDRTGKASWPFDHASSYAVVIDEESHDPDGDKTNPNTGAGNPFTDVKDTDWFYEDVLFVYENGIMLGTSDTTFSPNGTATRGMMATVLWRMEGSPKPSGKNPFTDVPDSEYYADAITWANEQGIFVGYGGGLFGPNDPITREQLATIFYRYAEYKGYDLTPADSLNRFTDKGEIADWAQYAVKWAVGSGLMFGTTDTTFAPKTTATRAQIAAMIHRFIEKYGLTEGVTATGLTGWIKPDLTLPPQTGDYSHNGLWAGIAMLSAGGGASTIAVFRRKRRKDGDEHPRPTPA